MFSITEETIEYLAKASRLTLTEEEKKAFSEDLTQIISYIDILHSVSINESQVGECDSLNIEELRDDVAEFTWSREEFFENAPEHVAGLIKVPVVIK